MNEDFPAFTLRELRESNKRHTGHGFCMGIVFGGILMAIVLAAAGCLK